MNRVISVPRLSFTRRTLPEADDRIRLKAPITANHVIRIASIKDGLSVEATIAIHRAPTTAQSTADTIEEPRARIGVLRNHLPGARNASKTIVMDTTVVAYGRKISPKCKARRHVANASNESMTKR